MNVSDTKKQIIKDLSAIGIKSSEIDAEILLEFVTKKSREFLLANPGHKLKNRETEELKNLIKKRKKHEPIAYITGHKEFFGLDFLVNKNVLIPRPETELLVEEASKFIWTNCHSELVSESNKMPNQVRHDKLKILDLGTGSGNIIISLAKNLSSDPYRFEPIGTNQYFFASDISEKALAVAKKNAKKHGVEKKIKFIQSDLFKNISGKFDLILANLPYVPIQDCNRFDSIEENQLQVEEIDFEPKNAIFADNNGTEIIKKFLTEAKKYIKNNGLILIEVDSRNAKSLATFAAKLFANVKILKDYSGKDRFIKIG